MLQEFKKFVLRGNVVDLAVGVVMGAEFAGVVSSFTSAFITPLIALLGGKEGFKELTIFVGKTAKDKGTEFPYGAFLQATLSFVITAAVIFFFVVKPLNHLMQRMRTQDPADPTTKKCPECLSEIAVDARRCAFCTSELAAA